MAALASSPSVGRRTGNYLAGTPTKRWSADGSFGGAEWMTETETAKVPLRKSNIRTPFKRLRYAWSAELGREARRTSTRGVEHERRRGRVALLALAGLGLLLAACGGS